MNFLQFFAIYYKLGNYYWLSWSKGAKNAKGAALPTETNFFPKFTVLFTIDKKKEKLRTINSSWSNV
jgi:hypothetical protein